MKLRGRAGFTAEELIVVLGIIAVGIGFFFLFARNSVSAARAMSCTSNLKELALSMRMYAQDNDGVMPPGPREFDGLMQYVKNDQIFKCPEDPDTEGAEADSPDAWERASYVMNPGVCTDDVPSTLIVADDEPDRHVSRTWIGVRLDGAAHRRRAETWDLYWGEVMADAGTQ